MHEILLAEPENFDEIFFAALLEHQSHTTERFLCPVREHATRSATVTHWCGTERRERSLFDHVSEAVISDVDVDAGKTICAQPCARTVEAPLANIRECRHRLAPIETCPQ